MNDVTGYAAWIAHAAQVIGAHRDHLTDLDRAIGDADHGLNMDRGMKAAAGIDAREFAEAGAYLKKIGMTLVSTVGGASGPLYGTFFMKFGAGLGGDEDAAAAFATGLRAGVDGVKARGRATTGEKTMVDALEPAAAAATAAAATGQPLADVLAAARDAAEKGAQSTVDMKATKGRASYLEERSRGTMDPGAASASLLLTAAKEAMAQ